MVWERWKQNVDFFTLMFSPVQRRLVTFAACFCLECLVHPSFKWDCISFDSTEDIKGEVSWGFWYILLKMMK